METVVDPVFPQPILGPELSHAPQEFSRPTSRRPKSRSQSATQGGSLSRTSFHRHAHTPRDRLSSRASELSVPVGNTPSCASPTPSAVPGIAPLPEVNLDSSEDETDTCPEFPGPNNPERARLLYRAACKQLGITPCARILRSVPTGVVNISHQGIGPVGARALSIALVTSMTVTELHLQGNGLGSEGMKHISDMIQSNGVLKVLDVSDNQLGFRGAVCLGKMVEDSDALAKLKAANNQFDEQAAIVLAAAIKKNTTLRVLDLSRNEFHESGGKVLGKALGDNEILENVNMSWNHLRNAGVMGMAECLQENISIKQMDLSMNGVGREGAEAIGHALRHNRALRKLSLRCCRINVDGLLLLLTRMNGNESLRSLDVSENPLTSEDAIMALRSILLNPSLALIDVRLENVMVSQEFLEVRDQIRETRPDFIVHFGGFLRVKDLPHRYLKEVFSPAVTDPLEMLAIFVKENNLRWMDLFVRLDTDKSCTISYEEFRTGIVQSGLKLTEHQLDLLIYKLDADGNGEIDFGELLDAYRKFQRKMLRKAGQSSRSNSRPSSRPSSRPGSPNSYKGDQKQNDVGQPRTLVKQNSRPSSPFAVDMSKPLGNTNELVLDSEYLKAPQKAHRPSIHEVQFHVPVLNSTALYSAIQEAKDSMERD